MGIPAIPMRPRGDRFGLKPEESDCLTWVVLSGCNRDEAFLRFVRPDYIGRAGTPAVKEAVKQFFAMSNVKSYMEAYRALIEERMNPTKEPKKKIDLDKIDDLKARSKAKLVEFAMSLADNIEDAEDPEFVLKLADKVGILDGSTEVAEAPRRYLPVTPCLTECAYRLFCEENGEDMCQYCKYHSFGEDNGVHYDKTEMLEVPLKSDTPQ